MKRDFTPNPKNCIHCGKPFVPQYTTTQAACSLTCAARYAKNQRVAKVKAEKAQTRERKRALETPRKWITKAQKEVNRWARMRDLLAGRNCISCGAPYRGVFGGAFDAGHFRSVGSASHLRFFTPNIRLQCVRCNRDLGGNTVEYRRRLVVIKGAAWVEWLESLHWVAKWDVDYLRRLTRVAKKRADRLEKRLELTSMRKETA